MAESQLSCLRCQSAMEIGFVPNPTHGQEVWFEGAAPTTFRGSFMIGKKRFVVIAYRCVACGYLESYARP
ncbi:MAG: hypothetical protein JWN71_4388 [Xanthobacteraceae bacterium]|nr:hypothetical protein [Xanthobacteraceae bacterium]